MIIIKYCFVLFITLITSGCGHNTVLNKGQSSFDLNKKSIALLSVRIYNQLKPDHQLEINCATIFPQSELGSFRSLRSGKYIHEIKEIYKVEKDKYNEYLLAFEIDAGTHNIYWLQVHSTWPVFGKIGAEIPTNLTATIIPNSVVYLGHVEAVLRKRNNDNEERAGIPVMLEIAVAGYHEGTFDVNVTDKFDEDIKLFASEYPALQNVKIEKSILPQWVRPENKK